jgi:hypothetical protein
LLLRIVINEEAGSAEVEVLDVEAGDFGPPTSGSEGEQHDRAVADRERSRRRPLEFERRGEPFGRDGGAAVVVAGVFTAGALEQIADHSLIGRRGQSRGAVKESDRRRPRAEGLRGRAAVAQRPQEGRDEGRVRPPNGSSPRPWAWAVNCRQPVS